MKAEIISVGTELLLGNIVNTNTAFLARELADLGFDMHYQSVVGDRPEHVIAAARTAAQRSDVIIFTGGLGPTDDDLTRESVAAAFSIKLVTDEVTKRRIEDYFRCRSCSANNFKQARVFDGGEVLQNENGTAPGLYIKKGKNIIILLPGPPHELEPLFKAQVAPRLSALSDYTIVSLTLREFGIPESQLEVVLGELLKGSNPTAALYAKPSEVTIRITAKSHSRDEAQSLCEGLAGEIRAVIGDFVYTDKEQTQAEVVVELLREGKKRVALAESMTGGLVAAALTDVGGASQVLEYGAVTYSDRIKRSVLGIPAQTLEKHTAVSAQVGARMASAARRLSGADFGVSVTGYAGPEGENVGLVFVCVASGRQVAVKKLELGNMRGRAKTRELSCKNALDMLRRTLLGMEIPDAEVYKDDFESGDDDSPLVKKSESLLERLKGKK